MKSFLSHLECTACSKKHEATRPINVCDCGGTLFCRYDMARAKAELNRGVGRLFELLPVQDRENVVSLGEGETPLLDAKRLAKHMSVRRLFVKDEGVNPVIAQP
jgi:threonine synthase